MHALRSVLRLEPVSLLVVAALVGALSLQLAPAAEAKTWTESAVEQSRGNPRYYYARTTWNNSPLTAYLSHGTTRYRIRMRGGSGNGSTNECASNAGWLPSGDYGYGSGGHAQTNFHLINKTWGLAVVRGWVWNLGNRQCSNGTWRTELFIHSQGTSGWTSSNYASAGCVKIDQDDRSHLSTRHRNAYNPNSGVLHVS